MPLHLLDIKTFSLFCFLIVFAFLTIVSVTRVYSVLYLICCYLCVGLIFLCYGFEFIAIMLLIVYIGAISIFFLFTVMMLGQRTGATVVLHEVLWNLIIITIFYCLMLKVLWITKSNFSMTYFHSLLISNGLEGVGVCDFSKNLNVEVLKLPQNASNIVVIGSVLYTWFAIPFIGASLILLIAIIGIIIIVSSVTKKEKSREEIVDQLLRVFDK